jgi:hypothetical protein
MSRLEVKRLDSPLARSTGRPSDAAEDARPHEQRQQATPTPRPKRQPDQDRSKPKLASVPESQPDTPAATTDVLDGLPNPPALTESLELLSTRLPISLRRSLSEFTSALRTRDGARVSQKSLPEQEVLAVLIWLAGSAENPQAVARLGAALDAYRARRYAAAAQALRPSVPARDSP